jgi:hypothetical protein
MNENTPIKTDVRTLLAVIVAVAAGVWAWASVKGEVASHTEQLQSIQHTVKADHDAIMIQGTLIQQQGFVLDKMDKKLDFITGASRTRPPANTPNQ